METGIHQNIHMYMYMYMKWVTVNYMYLVNSFWIPKGGGVMSFKENALPSPNIDCGSAFLYISVHQLQLG